MSPIIHNDPVLLGNTFPLSLVRRRVLIVPMPLHALQQRVSEKGFISFWGHRNTSEAAGALVGVNVTPISERPVLQLNQDRLPVLDRQTFTECWVISPDYHIGYRPSPGEEVRTDRITGWQILRLTWTDGDDRV